MPNSTAFEYQYNCIMAKIKSAPLGIIREYVLLKIFYSFKNVAYQSI